jgi:hypothetical protein
VCLDSPKKTVHRVVDTLFAPVGTMSSMADHVETGAGIHARGVLNF